MKNKAFFLIFVLIICASIGFYFFKNMARKPENVASVGNKPVENKINIGSMTIEGNTDGIKIEQIPIFKEESSINIPMPNLEREIKITTDMDDDAKKVAIAKIKDLSVQLKSNSDNLENWLALGIYRKIIGDYEGARDVWEYAGAISSKNSVSFNNLGELYAYYLKDNKKAEENYLIAIKNGPDQIYIYRNAYEFYRFALKNDAKAKAVLEQGIAANPGEPSRDLQNLLSIF